MVSDAHVHQLTVNIPTIKEDDPEIRKESQVYTASVSNDVMEKVMTYYSTWWKLKVAVSWLLHYKRYRWHKVLLCRGESLTSYELVKKRGHLCSYLFIDQLFWTRLPKGNVHERDSSHAGCHPYPIPQPIKVDHTSYSFQTVMWVLLRPTRTNQ